MSRRVAQPRDKCSKLFSKAWNVDSRNTPNQWRFDLAVLVSQNVALGDDRSPRYVGMRELELIRYSACGLTHNLDLSLDR